MGKMILREWRVWLHPMAKVRQFFPWALKVNANLTRSFSKSVGDQVGETDTAA